MGGPRCRPMHGWAGRNTPQGRRGHSNPSQSRLFIGFYGALLELPGLMLKGAEASWAEDRPLAVANSAASVAD